MKEVIKFKKVSPDAIIPNYAHKEDAGMDIYSNEDKVIKSKSWELIKTGFSMELPTGYEAQIRSKSGLSLKSGIIVLNSPGTIDENYRGEVGIILMNVSDKDYNVEKNQKVAQMVINKVEHFEIIETEEISDSSRGDGAFGSTGLKNNI